MLVGFRAARRVAIMPGQLDQTAESIMSQWAAFTRSEQGMELPLRGRLKKQGL